MLSCMTTPLGLMVIGPNGQPLRLSASHPAFRVGQDLVHSGLPAEQAWKQLLDLVANPLKAMLSWCERFGVTLREEQDSLHLNDVRLGREQWLQLLSKLQAVAGSPRLALKLAAELGDQAALAKVSQLCVHVPEREDAPLRLLRLERLPEDAQPGDRVVAAATTGDWFLVSYGGFSVGEDGALALSLGEVVQKVPPGAEELAIAQDVLEQPCVLGFNRTYRCEQGTADGWVEDFSFDSLVQARRNAQEMVEAGDEVRIVNRISGELVRLA